MSFRQLINNICVLLAVIGVTSSAFAANQCRSLFAPILGDYLSQEAINNKNQNSYIQNRGFFAVPGKEKDIRSSYEGALEEPFINDILSLNSNDVWLDGGAGSFSAQAHYLKFMKQKGDAPAKLIGVVDQISKETRYLQYLAKNMNHENFQPLVGKFVEDVQEVKNDSVTVISDVYGAYSYSPRPDLVLKKYLSWLKKGGRIYIAQSPPPSTKRGYDMTHSSGMYIQGTEERTTEQKSFFGMIKKTKTETIQVNGLTYLTWLKQISGIRIEIGFGIIAIEKVSDDIRIPELELLQQTDGHPPRRFFKIKENLLQ